MDCFLRNKDSQSRDFDQRIVSTFKKHITFVLYELLQNIKIDRSLYLIQFMRLLRDSCHNVCGSVFRLHG